VRKQGNFYRHGGSTTALSGSRRRRGDNAVAEDEARALFRLVNGGDEAEEASESAHDTGGDEQDEETDGGVLDRTSGDSI